MKDDEHAKIKEYLKNAEIIKKKQKALTKKREYTKRYILKLKEEDPQKFEEYLQKRRNYVAKYQREHKEIVNAYQRNRRKLPITGDKIREYMKNYMRKYRAENRNNINEKEREYYYKVRKPRDKNKKYERGN